VGSQTDMDAIDELSDREIARQTYQKVSKVEEDVEELKEDVDKAQNITAPLNSVVKSTKNKLLDFASWGLIFFLIVIGWVLVKLGTHLEKIREIFPKFSP